MEQLAEELMKLSDFSIDRCLKPQGFEEPSNVQLHYVCDASEVSYGTASYLRFINKEGHIHTVLVIIIINKENYLC